MKTRVYAVILTLIMVFGFMGISYYSNTYTMRGVVTSIQGGIAILEDDTHNVWMIDNDGLKEGERVRIRWDNNGTDYYREDDTIIKVKVVE